jgi:hypothetical protein
VGFDIDVEPCALTTTIVHSFMRRGVLYFQLRLTCVADGAVMSAIKVRDNA